MTAAVLALTAAVLMHVAWNLLARASHPDSRFLWWALVGYLIVLGPWSLYALVTEACSVRSEVLAQCFLSGARRSVPD